MISRGSLERPESDTSAYTRTQSNCCCSGVAPGYAAEKSVPKGPWLKRHRKGYQHPDNWIYPGRLLCFLIWRDCLIYTISSCIFKASFLCLVVCTFIVVNFIEILSQSHFIWCLQIATLAPFNGPLRSPGTFQFVINMVLKALNMIVSSTTWRCLYKLLFDTWSTSSFISTSREIFVSIPHVTVRCAGGW